MKKISLFIFVFSLFFRFNCYSKNIEENESVSIPIVIKTEVVKPTKVSENIKLRKKIIFIRGENIKEVSINKKKIHKKENRFSYNLSENKEKFINIDIKL
ncbi:MAG: hypothetical protein ACRCZO_13930 [Cetobacterium sp.]